MTSDSLLRMGAFVGVLTVMALWERVAPHRPLSNTRHWRWPANFGLIALDTLVVRLALPLTAVGAAALCAENGWGLLNVLRAPAAVELALAFVALDFAIYLQHVLFHAVPLLWSMHAVHHSDPELDATTGVRFHPAEMLLSMAIKLAVIAALGPAPAAVAAFEIALNAGSVFSHANVRLPVRVDGWLRWVIVTPSMHRVHHSAQSDETNSNFGFNLPWWDRLLRTYRASPRGGEAGAIGLQAFRDARHLPLWRLLALPFMALDQGRHLSPPPPRSAALAGAPGSGAPACRKWAGPAV